jgi:hypothetical protein
MANTGLLGSASQQSYYAGTENFKWQTGDAEQFQITVLQPVPTSADDIWVYINGVVVNSDFVQYNAGTSTVSFLNGYVSLSNNDIVSVVLREKIYGNYRYTNLKDIVTNFMFSYVGDGKIINRANRRDVLFHAKRAIQEFSYDITRVEKIQEVEVGPTLSVPMPQDFVGVVQISWVDKSGVEHVIPRGRITSKPSEAIAQDDEFNYTYDNDENLLTTSPLTNERFKDFNQQQMSHAFGNDDYFYNQDFPAERLLEAGKRYGGDPELMTRNGMYIIDESNGTINFSSELRENLITIKYISDGLGTDAEMKVHKFAEEAIYKHVAFSILSTMAQVPEYVVTRFRRDRRAAMRNAKLRMYELRIPELTQVMRGKSKQIKH